MGEVIAAAAVTSLTVIGAIDVGLWLYDKTSRKIAWHKVHKRRRAEQKQRKAQYATGDRRPAPIKIAQEYAAELAKREPVRKATGLFSDTTAQKLLSK